MFFKDDDTLSYMDANKQFKQKQKALRDPLNEDENSDTPFFEETQKKEPKPKKPSAFKKLMPYLKSLDWNPKHHPKLIASLVLLLIAIVILTIALRETPNPLIGKWRPMSKNIFLPVGDIEFFKDKMQALNITTTVSYDIEESKIKVVDLSNNTGIIFYIKDDKTIETNLLGVKTLYRKVEK